MSGLKLFGKTIGLPPEPVEAAEICEPAGAAGETSSNPNPDCSSGHTLLEDAKPNREDGEDPDSRQSQSNAPPTGPDKAALKKPETILPCPRCKSMETKFCYFNNYNVNQPRHFCRNCQRYWTAGGTMRNVPVGAGRRKNKNILAAASHFRPPVNHPNNTILVFNSDTGAPPCDSMVSVLSIVDKTARSLEMDGDDRSSGSSDSSSKDEMGGNVPIHKGGHWPYQWTSPPSFVPGIIPLPFHSATLPPYWGGPTICNVPFVITPQASTSPTLGKHYRDENTSKTQESSYSNDNLQKSSWGPKTLRIDDPREAEKSGSIWATIGKAFQSQSKGEEATEIQETPAALQVNPAALSRSVSFHESS